MNFQKYIVEPLHKTHNQLECTCTKKYYILIVECMVVSKVFSLHKKITHQNYYISLMVYDLKFHIYDIWILYVPDNKYVQLKLWS